METSIPSSVSMDTLELHSRRFNSSNQEIDKQIEELKGDLFPNTNEVISSSRKEIENITEKCLDLALDSLSNPEFGPVVHKAIAISVIEKLINYHLNTATMLQTEDAAPMAVIVNWWAEAGQLRSARQLLAQCDLGANDFFIINDNK